MKIVKIFVVVCAHAEYFNELVVLVIGNYLSFLCVFKMWVIFNIRVPYN